MKVRPRKESGNDVSARLPAPLVVVVSVGVLLTLAMALRGQPWAVSCYTTNNCDALTFVTAGELARIGISPYSSAERTRQISRTRLSGALPPFDNPFQYPPTSLLLFAGLSWFSGGVAFVTFLLLCAGAYVLTLSRFLEKHCSREGAFALLLSAAASSFLALNAFLGQTGALCGALAVATLVAWDSRPRTAGVAMGLLSIKPQYVLPLIVVALGRRDWRQLVSATVTFGALVLSSAVVFQATWWTDWFLALRQSNQTQPYMASWVGVVGRLTLAPVPPWATAAAFVTAMICLGAWCWGDRTGPMSRRLAGGLVVAALMSPNTHPYDLTVVWPALALVARRDRVVATGLTVFVASWIVISPARRWILTSGLVVLAARILQASRVTPTDTE